jgi:hypothetical protein
MISETFEQQKLRANFTFRIIEMAKKIRVNPISTAKNLPYGLSLAMGVIFTTFMFFGASLPQFSFFNSPVSPLFHSEMKVLKIGEIPVDIIKSSSMPMLSNQKGNDKKPDPNSQNAFFLATQAEEGTWTRKGDIPFTLSWSPACEFGGKIYLFDFGGGTWEYDPLTDKYQEKSRINGLGDHAAVVLNDKIYVTEHFGGMYEYDPIADKWTKKATAQFHKRGTPLAVLNGKIYAIGGVTVAETTCLSVIEEYDPAKDIWTRKRDLPSPLAWCSACTVDDKIYVFGGWNGGGAIQTVMEYDPNADKWTKKTDMPDAMLFLPKSAPVINGKVYIMGGLNNLVSSKMQIYDLKTDTWTKGLDMPTARYSSAAVAHKNKIFVFGGATGADFANNQMPTPKVEEYDIYGGNPPKAINAKGKMPSTWGTLKAK